MRCWWLVLIGCQHEGVRTQVFALPPADDGTLFAVVELGPVEPNRERYGRLGDVTQLGGPLLEIEADDLYVAQFAPGTFNGVRGPELVFAAGLRDSRDGLDAVRLPEPTHLFEVIGGGLDAAAGDLSELRVPCDPARAGTRPSVEIDPTPRCPVAKASVVTCDAVAPLFTERHARIAGADLKVSLAQKGCRVEVTCIVGTSCAAPFPMHAILPPHGAVKGEAALMELVSGSYRCTRIEGEVPTFQCPNDVLTLSRE